MHLPNLLIRVGNPIVPRLEVSLRMAKIPDGSTRIPDVHRGYRASSVSMETDTTQRVESPNRSGLPTVFMLDSDPIPGPGRDDPAGQLLSILYPSPMGFAEWEQIPAPRRQPTRDRIEYGKKWLVVSLGFGCPVYPACP